MATKERITLTRLRTYKPEKRAYRVWDSDTPGLGVKVNPGGSKVWIFQYSIHGKRPRLTIGPTDRVSPDQARKICKTWSGQIASGIDPKLELERQEQESRAAFAKKTTVQDLMQRFMSEHCMRRNKESTQRKNKDRIEKVINPRLGHIPLSELSRKDLLGFKASLSETPGQFNQARAVLSKALNLAVEDWELIDTSPLKGVSGYRTNERDRYLKPDELKRLVDSIKSIREERTLQGISASASLAAEAVFKRGLRISEIINLQWDNIDWDAGELVIPDGKTGRSTLVISPVFDEFLRDLKTWHQRFGIESKYLFPSPRGYDSPVSYTAVYKFVKEAAIKANLEDVSPHVGRSSMATLLAANNASSFAVQSAFGWKTPQMANRYVKDANRAAAKAFEDVGSVF